MLSAKEISRTCMYCGTRFEDHAHREQHYLIKQCRKCRKTTRIKKDFNDIGNGKIPTIEDRIKEETRKMFLNPRMH